MYFHKDRSGFHLSVNPQRTSKASSAQKLQRSIFSRCINAWTEHNWSLPELQVWYDFAKRHFTQNSAGTIKTSTAQNLFVGYNCVRLRNNLPISFVPPND